MTETKPCKEKNSECFRKPFDKKITSCETKLYSVELSVWKLQMYVDLGTKGGGGEKVAINDPVL
jgi:hypothetical protein